MKKDSIYYNQVQLLVQVLPLLDSEKCFALKEGTVINLFFRELPRLSVDEEAIMRVMAEEEPEEVAKKKGTN